MISCSRGPHVISTSPIHYSIITTASLRLLPCRRHHYPNRHPHPTIAALTGSPSAPLLTNTILLTIIITHHHTSPSPSRPSSPSTAAAEVAPERLDLPQTISRRLHCTRQSPPAAADKYLADEIYRAACDPGALGVFRSVFYLPPPRPINFLIDTFAGPTLVLQGDDDR